MRIIGGGSTSRTRKEAMIRIHLPQAEVERLEHQFRTTDDRKLRDRLQVVLLAHKGRPHKDIAADLCINRRSVQRWLNAYCERGLDGLRPRKAPGQPGHIPAEMAADVLPCEAVEEDAGDGRQVQSRVAAVPSGGDSFAQGQELVADRLVTGEVPLVLLVKRQPAVQQDDVGRVEAPNHQVPGFEVAVQHASSMHLRHGAREIRSECSGLVQGEGPDFAEGCVQCLAWDELHHKPRGFTLLHPGAHNVSRVEDSGNLHSSLVEEVQVRHFAQHAGVRLT